MSVASVPLKTVLMYHADATNESIPAGYEVCDGRTLSSGNHNIAGGTAPYTLPDLRNRFLLGADITKGATDPGNSGSNATDAPGPMGRGGAHVKTLSLGELPSHTHTGSTDSTGLHTHTGSTTDAGGAHSHTGAIGTAGAHAHSGSSISSVGDHAHTGTAVAAGGTHTHTLTDPGHSHTYVQPTNLQAYTTGGDGPVHTVSGQTSRASTGISIDANSGSHSHTVSLTPDGGHGHTLTVVSDGDHTHSITTSSAGSSHSHTISGLSSDGLHSHALTINATGGGNGFDTRPRYYGVVFIMKVRI
jgi:hypothetical protein